MVWPDGYADSTVAKYMVTVRTPDRCINHLLLQNGRSSLLSKGLPQALTPTILWRSYPCRNPVMRVRWGPPTDQMRGLVTADE